MKKSALVITLILALSLTISTNATPKIYAQETKTQNTITVSGTKKIFVMPDVAHISLNANTFNADISVAQKNNSAIIDKLMTGLVDLNVAPVDIVTTGYTMYPQYSYKNGTSKLTGYNVSNCVKVRVTDFSLLGRIIDAAGAAGVSNIGGIEYSLSNHASAYQKALEGAVANACQKADTIAKASLASIKSVIEIKETEVFSPTSYTLLKTMDIAAGDTAINTGEITICASITAVYLLQA